MNNGFQETRSRTLLGVTLRAIAEHQLVVLSFATQVAELYIARVPDAERVVKFRLMAGTDTDQLLATQRHNAQIVDRYLKGVVKAFPADLEEVWIECLPPPYREDALRLLAARMGMLPTRLPTDTPRAQLMSFREVMGTFGKAFESATPVFADGRVDADDAPYLERAITDVDNHVAHCITVRSQMVQVRDSLGEARRHD